MSSPLVVMYLDTDQAAARLGLSSASLRRWRRDASGHAGPPVVRFGRVCRYLITDLDAWAAAQAVRA